MPGNESFSSREQLPTTSQVVEPGVDIRFEGDFIGMIDKLVDTLEATTGGGDMTARRRIAIATAVSTLSDYSGDALFVRRRGRLFEIEGLWR